MPYQIAPKWETSPLRICVFADAYKPYKDAEFEGDGEYKLLDIVLLNDGTPCTPRIKALIATTLGHEWQLVDWWIPESNKDCAEL